MICTLFKETFYVVLCYVILSGQFYPHRLKCAISLADGCFLFVCCLQLC